MTQTTRATNLNNGDMVITPDGGVGVLVCLRAIGTSTVTFGAAGPVGSYDWKTLRRATRRESMDAGLDGVGCSMTDGPYGDNF